MRMMFTVLPLVRRPEKIHGDWAKMLACRWADFGRLNIYTHIVSIGVEGAFIIDVLIRMQSRKSHGRVNILPSSEQADFLFIFS